MFKFILDLNYSKLISKLLRFLLKVFITQVIKDGQSNKFCLDASRAGLGSSVLMPVRQTDRYFVCTLDLLHFMSSF